MSELIQTGFDYGDLPAEKVLECETAFQTACAIENQAVVMIGEQFSKVKANLRFLRNGNGWYEWCDKRLGKSIQTAENYINAFQNRESIKNFDTFGKSALFLLTAPSTPQEVRDRADALAEAGEDVSVKAIKQLKADVEAERQARELAERRNEEWKAQWKGERDKAGQLQTELDIAKAILDQKPEPVIVEKEVIPDDYETAKSKAASLEKEIADLKKRQDKIVSDQLRAKLQERQQELDKLEADKRTIEDIVARKKAYLDSLDGEVKRIETHHSVINGVRLELIGLAAFLNDLDPIEDRETHRRWLGLAGMLEEAASAIRQSFADSRPLTVIPGGLA